MKILVVSDIVEPKFYSDNRKDMLLQVDLILSCGDLPPEYLTHLISVCDAPLYYVRGNHDIRYTEKPPMGGRNIHGRIAYFNQLRLLGLEGSRWYNGGPIQYTERQMRRHVRKLAFQLWWNKHIDIIVTHAPPRYIHDAEDRCHRGFKTYRKLIDRYKPRYFFHGHIHCLFDDPAKRMTTVNQTKVVNSCGYIFLDIETQKSA